MYYKYKKEGFQVSSDTSATSRPVGLYIGISVSVAVILVCCLILYIRKKDRQNFGFRFY